MCLTARRRAKDTGTEPSARERQHCTLPARVTRHGITFPFTFPETRGMTSQVAQWADTCLHLHSVVRAGEVSIGNLPVSALESLLVASCQWTADLCAISQAAAEAIRKHCRPLTHTHDIACPASGDARARRFLSLVVLLAARMRPSMTALCIDECDGHRTISQRTVKAKQTTTACSILAQSPLSSGLSSSNSFPLSVPYYHLISRIRRGPQLFLSLTQSNSLIGLSARLQRQLVTNWPSFASSFIEDILSSCGDDG